MYISFNIFFGAQKNCPNETVLLTTPNICQGFSLASAIGHSPKIVPDVRDFAVQFGQFVRDDFRKHTLYSYAQ